MKMPAMTYAISLLIGVTHCLPAYAENVSGMKETMQHMQKRLEKLEAENKTIQAAQKKNNNIDIALNPLPKFKSRDGAFSAKFIGFGQADSVFHMDDTVDHPDSTTVKRARLGVAGTLLTDWGYKFLYEFGGNNPQLQDMFLTYNGLDNTQLIIGQHKEPFGLEWQSPAKYWTFMELPLTNTFTPRRAIGAGIRTSYKDFRMHVGIFGENANKSRSDDEGYSIDGHFVYTPIHDATTHLHIGASTSYRVPDAGSSSVTYRAGHETSSASTNYINTTISSVDNITLGGIEALGIWGPFLLQGEYIMADVKRGSGFSNESFSSYYAQAAWMVTGETRQFSKKKHAFKRVIPDMPFSLNGDGWGAVELAVRAESLNVSDKAVIAGELSRYTLGVNWHPNSYTRLMVNLSHVESDSKAAVPSDSTQVIGFRAQIDF